MRLTLAFGLPKDEEAGGSEQDRARPLISGVGNSVALTEGGGREEGRLSLIKGQTAVEIEVEGDSTRGASLANAAVLILALTLLSKDSSALRWGASVGIEFLESEGPYEHRVVLVLRSGVLWNGS
jgi:hypothetical protein